MSGNGTHLTMIRARARWNPVGSRAADNAAAIADSMDGSEIPSNVTYLGGSRDMSIIDLEESRVFDPEEPTDKELMELQIAIESGQFDDPDVLEDERFTDFLLDEEEYDYDGFGGYDVY